MSKPFMNTRFDGGPQLTQKNIFYLLVSMFLLQKCTIYNIFYTFATIKFSTKYTLSLHTLGQNLVNQNEKVTHENPH